MRVLRKHGSRAGFSLVELSISLFVFTVVGYSLVGIVQIGNQSRETVTAKARLIEEMREANEALSEELQLASDANMTVETLPDGNDQVTFMHRIEVGGALQWGIFDASLGDTPDTQNMPGWRIRYTVESLAGQTRNLVRQVIDDAGVVVSESVVLENLREGTGDRPGFKVTAAGSMWEIRIAQEGADGHHGVQEMLFHVRTRN